MNLENHISNNKFFEILQMRLQEYEEAIFGNKSYLGIKLSMTNAMLYYVNELKRIEAASHIFGTSFWGYGINYICDGIEEIKHPDVFEIKKIPGLNKHHEIYRKLLLLIFNVQEGCLYVSIFSLDSCSIEINSTINTKYSLIDFENARFRTRPNAIYVDFIFKSINKPISFQIDTYHFGGYNYSGMLLAKYYIDTIKQLAIVRNQQIINTMKKEDNGGGTFNFFGDVQNMGQIGGKENIQSNSKINVKNNQDYKDLKEHILELEEYQVEDLKWKELLMQALAELNNLEIANSQAQQKTSTDKIDFIFKKLKDLKDWTAITLLPAEIVTKGGKMLELWESLKHFLRI